MWDLGHIIVESIIYVNLMFTWITIVKWSKDIILYLTEVSPSYIVPRWDLGHII